MLTKMRGFCLSGTMGLAIVAAGCGRAANTTAKPNAAPPPATVAASPWAPDPGQADKLPQSVTFDTYQLLLPQNYTADEPQSRGALKILNWRTKAAANQPSDSLTAALASDARMVAEAKKNMRQALVNFSAGMTDSSGIKISNRGPTETGSLAGLDFSRITWSGTTSGGEPASGFAYGAVDGDRALMLIVTGVGANAADSNKLMEAAIATLKKK